MSAQSTEEVRGSFLVAGVPLGPSPLSHPGFQHHADSQQVDLQREEPLGSGSSILHHIEPGDLRVQVDSFTI